MHFATSARLPGSQTSSANEANVKRTTLHRRYIIHYPRRMLSVRYGVGLSYARPGGGPILKEDKSLRHVNGIWINWPTGSVWLLFRRPSY